VAQVILNTYTTVRTEDGLVYSWGRGAESRYGTPKHGKSDATPELCQELAGRHVFSVASGAMHMFGLVKPKGT
jgi:alpha-tubulin suppressor-like RCC1 family protein